jgi:hypothetical protein
VIDAELLRQRRAAEQDINDTKLLYRYRVAALLGGVTLRCAAGDRVKQGDEEGRVLRVEETPTDPERVHVRFFSDDSIKQVDSRELRIVAPHRPGVLLGEDELKRRLDDESADSQEPRGLETLEEVARRQRKDALPLAIKLFEQVHSGRCDALRKALTAIVRSRPYGDVDVALRHLDTHPMDEDLVELPALAAAATEASHAKEILDRLEALDSKPAVTVLERTGRGLVGAGGPAFSSASVRERVSALAREHPDKDVRIALFVYSATGLQSEDLLQKAFASDTPEVRGAAACELLRRGKADPVLAHLPEEESADVIRKILGAIKGPLSANLLGGILKTAKKHPALEELALIRLAECSDDGALDLLAPWLDKARKTNAAAAMWCAGLLGRAEAGDKIVRLLATKKLADDALPLALEALARLGHADAAQAFDAWGHGLMGRGTWGEEWADTVGLLLGRKVDAHELLGRVLVAGPAGPVRRARALDAASVLAKRGQAAIARQVRPYLPSALPRFQPLVESLAG